MENINIVGDRLINVREQIAALQEEEEALKKQMQAYMLETGKDTIESEKWKVIWKFGSGNRFDVVTFKAKYPKLYREYLITKEIRYFKMFKK